MKKRRFLILGAGISGLTAARALQDAGHEYALLESCPSAGGLTRSIYVSDFCFDYTGHFLHLARFKSPMDIPYAGLKKLHWEELERRSMCYIKGTFITAPIQYHLRQLPAHLLSACVSSYNSRPPLADTRDVSLKDFIISGFGRKLADVFLIPQNEKTLACPLDQISGASVKRFFPPPDDELIRTGIKLTPHPSTEYNSRFWYPRSGGIDALVKGLQFSLRNMYVLQEVREIDVANRTVRTRAGNTWNWDILLPSIPLRELCKKTGDRALRTYAGTLSHSSTIVFNIGARRPLPPELSGVHWVYIPDRSIPFYRVGFYSNINQGMCPPYCSSLYVEVGVPGADIDTVHIIKNVQPKVFKSLQQLGWVKPEEIVCCVIHIIRCAYVHHTIKREQVMQNILERLAQFDIYPIGRYGLWDYISMEDSIISAMDTVKKLI